MKLTIIRIEEFIITCELDDGVLLDIDKKWFSDSIKIGDTLDFDIETIQK